MLQANLLVQAALAVAILPNEPRLFVRFQNSIGLALPQIPILLSTLQLGLPLLCQVVSLNFFRQWGNPWALQPWCLARTVPFRGAHCTLQEPFQAQSEAAGNLGWRQPWSLWKPLVRWSWLLGRLDQTSARCKIVQDLISRGLAPAQNTLSAQVGALF